jgi:hypothetical protein
MQVARCPAPIDELHIRPRWPVQLRPKTDMNPGSDTDDDEDMDMGRLPPQVGAHHSQPTTAAIDVTRQLHPHPGPGMLG